MGWDSDHCPRLLVGQLRHSPRILAEPLLCTGKQPKRRGHDGTQVPRPAGAGGRRRTGT